MLNKYQDFLFESIILESILVYSDEFRQIISNIESPVAKVLLDIESKDLTLANNYIDITDNKEEISFISDKKAQTLLNPESTKRVVYYIGGGGILKHSDSNKEMFEMLDYQPIGDKSYKPTTEEKGEVQARATSTSTGKVYLKVKFTNGVSVISEEKVRYEDLTKVPFLLNRQKIRVGKGIRGILKSSNFSFSDSDIEKFVNSYRGEIDKLNDVFKQFELVKGDRIKYWYNLNNYQFDSPIGQLGKSCMRYEKCQKYFDIYTQNPDVCSLLILKTEDGESIKGRALVWNLDNPQGTTYMDRIYTHEDSDIEIFKEYAQKNGWYRKHYNNYQESGYIYDPNGIEVALGELSVKLKKGEYDYYPYLDSLKYYNTHTGELSTEETDDTIELTDTGGGYAGGSCDFCGGDERVTCPECGGDGEETCYDCSGYGEIECSHCDGEGTHDCNNCWGEGKIDCDACSGQGEIECDDCSGTGEDDEGEECSSCEGRGKLECGECDSEGSVECDECSGSGYFECSYCDGNGTNECDECGGVGTQTCSFCYGDGDVNCPECG